MNRADSRPTVRAFRDWLDADERHAERIARYVIAKALSGHFGFMLLLLDIVDGKPHQTAEDEVIFEAGCVRVVDDDGRDAGTAQAA
jgi:hypothetical protein